MCHPKWYQKLNPLWWLGNCDQPLPDPPTLWKDKPEWLRKLLWFVRNPGHNFTFYVIGVRDKDFKVIGDYPDKVFNPEGGWKLHIVEYNWLKLPFISYIDIKSQFKFYIGWRTKGNFGVKIQKGD